MKTSLRTRSPPGARASASRKPTSPTQASGSASAVSASGEELADPLREDRLDERLAGREVPVEGADAEPGPAGDLVERGLDARARRTPRAQPRRAARGCASRRGAARAAARRARSCSDRNRKRRHASVFCYGRRHARPRPLLLGSPPARRARLARRPDRRRRRLAVVRAAATRATSASATPARSAPPTCSRAASRPSRATPTRSSSTRSSGTLTDPAARSAIAPMLARVAKLPHVTGVVSPYDPNGGDAHLARTARSASRRSLFDERRTRCPTGAIKQVIARRPRAIRSSQLQVELGGQAIEQTEFARPARRPRSGCSPRSSCC